MISIYLAILLESFVKLGSKLLPLIRINACKKLAFLIKYVYSVNIYAIFMKFYSNVTINICKYRVIIEVFSLGITILKSRDTN